jgi:hypothetical protein
MAVVVLLLTTTTCTCDSLRRSRTDEPWIPGHSRLTTRPGPYPPTLPILLRVLELHMHEAH